MVDNLAPTPWSVHYHLIYPMLFRMLYCCGLRINEALCLKNSDVDVENGILTVTKAKLNTSRLVPMSKSLTDYCKIYVIKMGLDMNSTGYFYPSRDRGKYNRNTVYVKLKQFMKEVNIFTDGSVGPRVHDLRYPNLYKTQTFGFASSQFCNPFIGCRYGYLLYPKAFGTYSNNYYNYLFAS